MFSTCFNSVRKSKMSRIFCRISSSSMPSPSIPRSLGITEEGTESGASLIASYSVRTYGQQERIGPKQTVSCPEASASTPVVSKTNQSICQNCSESLLQQPMIGRKTLRDNENRRKRAHVLGKKQWKNRQKHIIRDPFSAAALFLLRFFGDEQRGSSRVRNTLIGFL